MKFIILIVFGFLSAQVWSQSVLSVDQAIDYGLKNNAMLKSVTYEAESQKQLRKTSFDLPKTNVVLMYGQYNSYAKDNNFTITQNIPVTALGSQGALNRSIAASGELKKASTQNDLVYQIKQTYYQLSFMHARHALLQKQDTIYEGFFKSASLRYKAGDTKLLEQTTAEVQRNEIKNQLSQNERNIIALQTQLATALNSEAIFDIADTALTPLPLRAPLDTVDYLTNPTLAYTRQQVEIAKNQKKVEVARFAPELIVGYFNQTLIGTPNPEKNQMITNANRFTGFELGVALPLWFVPYQARVKASEFNKKAIQSSYQNFEISLKGQLKQAMQQYLKNKSSLDYYRNSAVPNSDLILKQSQAAFKGGEIGYAEYLLGLHNAIIIKEGYLQTLNDYNQSIIYIEYLTGNK